MGPTTRVLALAALLVLAAVVIAACEPAPTTPPATADLSPAGMVIGCASIEAAECHFVAGKILAMLPAARGRPFDIEISLSSCPDAPCPRSLAARSGLAFVDYADAGEPLAFDLAGPPQAPQIVLHDGFNWSGMQVPMSTRTDGPGPFAFDLGHCGLSHVVDFDGSFWVPIGQLDGEASGLINGESGQMRLVGPDLAIYSGVAGFTAHLARFPGPKRVFICL